MCSGDRFRHARRTARSETPHNNVAAAQSNAIITAHAAPQSLHGFEASRGLASAHLDLLHPRSFPKEPRAESTPLTSIFPSACIRLRSVPSAPQGHRARQQAVAQRRAPLSRDPLVDIARRRPYGGAALALSRTNEHRAQSAARAAHSPYFAATPSASCHAFLAAHYPSLTALDVTMPAAPELLSPLDLCASTLLSSLSCPSPTAASPASLSCRRATGRCYAP